MNDALTIAVKACAGGSLVTVFALVGEVLRPKYFAGLFSAAPSVALASLIVTVIGKGDHEAVLASIGMLFGAVGFVVYALVTRSLLLKLSAVAASSVAMLTWAMVSIGGYYAILR